MKWSAVAGTWLIAAVLAGPLAADGAAAETPSVDPTEPLAGGARDRSLNADVTRADGLELTSIIFGAEKRVAIVNGRRVQEMQTIGQWRVLAIARDAVTVDGPAGERVLRLVRTPVKRAGSYEKYRK